MKMSLEQKRSRCKFLLAPTIVLTLAIFSLLICFFLPLLTATGDFRENLLLHPSESNAFPSVLSNEQAVDISMHEFFKIYWDAYAKNNSTEKVLSICIFCGTSIISLFTLSLSLLKHPIGVVFFNILAIAPHALATIYISEKRFLEFYEWGYAKSLYYAFFALVFVCAIWMIIKKVSFNKKAKAELAACEDKNTN